MADNLSRDVLLRIRAQNLATADFNAARTAVDTLTASLDKQIQAANRAEISEKELSATLTKLQQATQNFTGVATMIDQFKSFDKVLADQATRVTKAGETLEQYRLKLEQSKDTSAGAERQLERLAATFEKQQAKLRENTQTFQEMGAALQKAGVDTNALVEAENRLRQAADQAGAAISKISDAKLNLAENTRKAKEEAAKLAAAEKQAAEEAKKAATAHAATIREQEEAQLKAFKAFQTSEKQIAEGRAQALRDVQVGVNAYKAAEEARRLAAHEAVQRQIEEQRRLTEQTREQLAQRGRDADRAARDQFEKFRQSILNRNRATAQEAGQPAANTPIPGTAPVVPGMPRTDALGRPGRGASAQVGFLGLRPYELTNLGYQVNDVITGLASGQNAMQVLAQQGGQFIQIFGLAALKWFPAIAAAAAVAAVAIGSVTKALQQAATFREFDAALTANANAANYNAKALSDLVDKLEDLSVARADAIKIVRAGVTGDVRPELLESFTVLARNISRVDKVDIKEAMDDLVAGLTGGRDAVEKLLSKYPALTDARRKEVIALMEEGRQGKAQIEILKDMLARYTEADNNGTSKFQKSVELLNASWNRLLRDLGNSAVITSLIDNLDSVVKKIDSWIKRLDDLTKILDNPRIQAFLHLISMPVLPSWATPDLGIGAPGTGEKIPQPWDPEFPAWWEKQKANRKATAIPTEVTATPRVSTGMLPFDTDALRELLAVLREASKSLPEGYTARVSSTERPGAVVAGTGRPSEHGSGRAIDVHIVDAQGREVPGSMGAGGPEYRRLDIAFEAAARKLYPGQAFAIGSTFQDRPDAGHFSTRGREAEQNARRRGVLVPDVPDTTGQRDAAPKQVATEREIADLKERNALQRAGSKAIEEQLLRQQYLREAQGKTNNESQQAIIVEERLKTYRYDRDKIEAEHAEKDLKDRINDRTNADRIAQAGQEAVNKAIQEGRTNYKDLYDLRKKGEETQRALVQKEITESDQLVAIKKQLAGLERGNQLKDATELDKALEGVKNRYVGIYEELKKIEERSTTLDKGAIGDVRKRIEAAQKVEERIATVGSYEAQAKESLRTRNELVQSYVNQQSRGDITISEQQKLTKEAFDLTAESIKKAADEMEAFLKTAEGMAQPPLKIAEMNAKIKELRSELKYVDPFLKGLRDTISTSLGTGLSTAFNTVGEAIGGLITKTKSWKDVLDSVKNAGINLFTQLLKDIANYIIKAEAAKLASSLFGVTTAGDAATGAAGSGVFGFLGKILGIGSSGAGGAAGAAAAAETTSAGSAAATAGFLFHRGGVVGRSTVPAMSVPAYWFAHAPRYHRGSVIGMGPNEQAAILQRGEEVLTRDDPRNVLNRARMGGGRQDVNIRSVLVADPSYVPTAMSGAQGERIVVQHLVKNAATVRQLLK